MKLKHLILFFLFFSCSLIFSQSDKIESWSFNSNKNLDYPFTKQELSFIDNAFNDETLKRINKIKALEKYVKDILRNRVQILNKKYHRNENLPKLSSVRGSITTKKLASDSSSPTVGIATTPILYAYETFP